MKVVRCQTKSTKATKERTSEGQQLDFRRTTVGLQKDNSWTSEAFNNLLSKWEGFLLAFVSYNIYVISIYNIKKYCFVASLSIASGAPKGYAFYTKTLLTGSLCE